MTVWYTVRQFWHTTPNLLEHLWTVGCSWCSMLIGGWFFYFSSAAYVPVAFHFAYIENIQHAYNHGKLSRFSPRSHSLFLSNIFAVCRWTDDYKYICVICVVGSSHFPSFQGDFSWVPNSVYVQRLCIHTQYTQHTQLRVSLLLLLLLCVGVLVGCCWWYW